jgi:hypothetical protein
MWMMSLMPPTAFFSTSLACAKACSCVTSSPITSSNFSFSTTIRRSEELTGSRWAVRSSAVAARHQVPAEVPGCLHSTLCRHPLP